jgi:hypothetical protein
MTSSTAPSTGLLAPYQDGAHHQGGLAVAVDAALALLVAGGVPREVVVDDGVEVLLEVDAFGEAVGGDEHAALGAVPRRSTCSRRSSEVSSPVTAMTVVP